MPAPGIGMLVATAVIVAGVAIGLTAIVIQLLRISAALDAAGGLIGQLPGILAPVDAVVGRLAGALVKLRSLLDPSFKP